MATVSKPLRKASITALPWAGSSSYFPASFCIPSPLLTAASTAALPSLPGSLQEFSHFREAERSTESFLHMFTQHTLSCHWGLSWNITSTERFSMTSPCPPPANGVWLHPLHTSPGKTSYQHHPVQCSSEHWHDPKLFCVLAYRLAWASALTFITSINLIKSLKALSLIWE